MSYSDALELQLDLADFWQRDGGRLQAQYIADLNAQANVTEGQLGKSYVEGKPSDFRSMMIQELTYAETFYVSKQISDLLVASLDSFPSTPLYLEDTPCYCGFFYFEVPIDFGLEERRLRALSFVPGIMVKRETGDYAQELVLSYYSLEQGFTYPLFSYLNW